MVRRGARGARGEEGEGGEGVRSGCEGVRHDTAGIKYACEESGEVSSLEFSIA